MPDTAESTAFAHTWAPPVPNMGFYGAQTATNSMSQYTDAQSWGGEVSGLSEIMPQTDSGVSATLPTSSHVATMFQQYAAVQPDYAAQFSPAQPKVSDRFLKLVDTVCNDLHRLGVQDVTVNMFEQHFARMRNGKKVAYRKLGFASMEHLFMTQQPHFVVRTLPDGSMGVRTQAYATYLAQLETARQRGESAQLPNFGANVPPMRPSAPTQPGMPPPIQQQPLTQVPPQAAPHGHYQPQVLAQHQGQLQHAVHSTGYATQAHTGLTWPHAPQQYGFQPPPQHQRQQQQYAAPPASTGGPTGYPMQGYIGFPPHHPPAHQAANYQQQGQGLGQGHSGEAPRSTVQSSGQQGAFFTGPQGSLGGRSGSGDSGAYAPPLTSAGFGSFDPPSTSQPLWGASQPGAPSAPGSESPGTSGHASDFSGSPAHGSVGGAAGFAGYNAWPAPRGQ